MIPWKRFLKPSVLKLQMLLCSTITVLRFSCPPVKVDKEVNPDLKVRV